MQRLSRNSEEIKGITNTSFLVCLPRFEYPPIGGKSKLFANFHKCESLEKSPRETGRETRLLKTKIPVCVATTYWQGGRRRGSLYYLCSPQEGGG